MQAAHDTRQQQHAAQQLDIQGRPTRQQQAPAAAFGCKSKDKSARAWALAEMVTQAPLTSLVSPLSTSRRNVQRCRPPLRAWRQCMGAWRRISAGWRGSGTNPHTHACVRAMPNAALLLQQRSQGRTACCNCGLTRGPARCGCSAAVQRRWPAAAAALGAWLQP